MTTNTHNTFQDCRVHFWRQSFTTYIIVQLQYVWLHVVTESSSYTMSDVVHYTSKEEIRPWVKWSPTRGWIQMKNIKPLALKVVVVAYEGWWLTRVANQRTLSSKSLLFWIGGCLQVVVTDWGSTVLATCSPEGGQSCELIVRTLATYCIWEANYGQTLMEGQRGNLQRPHIEFLYFLECDFT